MRIWVGFQGGDKECSKEHRRHETQVSSLGWEDPMEKRMATHCSILSWERPWTTVGDMGSIPGQGTTILSAAWHGQKKKGHPGPNWKGGS